MSNVLEKLANDFYKILYRWPWCPHIALCKKRKDNFKFQCKRSRSNWMNEQNKRIQM